MIKPYMLECAKLVFGKTAAKKIAQISLSNGTVHFRNDEIFSDIQAQVTEKIKRFLFRHSA